MSILSIMDRWFWIELSPQNVVKINVHFYLLQPYLQHGKIEIHCLLSLYHNIITNMQKFEMSLKSDEPNIDTEGPVGYIGIVIIIL